mgnify:CR=1 FL=1
MIECPTCGRQYRPGALFCGVCGVYLLTGGPLRTEALLEEGEPAPRANPWAIEALAGAQGEAPQVVCFTLLGTGRQVSLPVGVALYLGRLDAAHGVFPDLDLASDGGLEAGVSRRHAKVYCRSDRFFLEDVGSANGTFLNGKRLTPYLPYPLHAGDVLRMGKVELAVAFGS